MFRSKAFTIIGIVSFLLIAATITLQILELDSYGDWKPLIDSIF